MKENKILSLDKYLQEISREPLLSPEEEIELSKKIHAGDRAALEKLVRANARFVVSVAKQYKDQGLSLPDLINVGNVGLIKAAEKFDETRGIKFISYAVWWIRERILQALAEEQRHKSSHVLSVDALIPASGLPGETVSAETNQALSMLNRRERRIIECYFGINGQLEMTLDELAESMGLSRERIRQIREKAIRKLRALGINDF